MDSMDNTSKAMKNQNVYDSVLPPSTADRLVISVKDIRKRPIFFDMAGMYKPELIQGRITENELTEVMNELNSILGDKSVYILNGIYEGPRFLTWMKEANSKFEARGIKFLLRVRAYNVWVEVNFVHFDAAVLSDNKDIKIPLSVFDGSLRDKHYPTSKLKQKLTEEEWTSAMNRLSDASDTTWFYLGIFWLMALIGLITLLLCFCLILIANPLSWWKKRKQMGAVIADLNATYGPREVEWEINWQDFCIYVRLKNAAAPAALAGPVPSTSTETPAAPFQATPITAV